MEEKKGVGSAMRRRKLNRVSKNIREEELFNEILTSA